MKNKFNFKEFYYYFKKMLREDDFIKSEYQKSKYYDDESNKDWFLEYPCTLMKTPIEEDDIDAFCNSYVDALY